MGPVVVVDARSRPLRRWLGPLGWAVLVELALSAEAVDSDGSLACPVSARSIAAAVGVSREAAARALRSLIDAGLVRRSVGGRGSGGRFGPGGYRLVVPEGLAVSGVAGAGPASAGRPDPGGPASAVGAAGEREIAGTAPGGPGPVVAAGQASLFAGMTPREESAGDRGRAAPREGWE